MEHQILSGGPELDLLFLDSYDIHDSYRGSSITPPHNLTRKRRNARAESYNRLEAQYARHIHQISTRFSKQELFYISMVAELEWGTTK